MGPDTYRSKMRVEDLAGGVFDVVGFLFFVAALSAVTSTVLVTSPVWGPLVVRSCAVSRADRRHAARSTMS